MHNGTADADDWDGPEQILSEPISQSEFAALSISTRRGEIPHLPGQLINVFDWFDGKSNISNNSFSAVSPAQCSSPTSSQTESYRYGRLPPRMKPEVVVTEKAYVEQYMNQLEAEIQQISMRPNVGLLDRPIPGQRTMWIDPDPVYTCFNMDTRNENTSSLAIIQYKEEILDSLRNQQVIIVEGFTGSGKTTQIPQYILDDFAAQGKLGNIVVTQPRRIAAQSVADRVCKERGWGLGDLVGYQVGLNRRTSEKTRLTYVTTGVLLQILISKKSLRDYTHIIVDEVHERDLDTDLLILVIKKLLVETADTTTKIVLMSATLNAEKFGNYFPKWRVGNRRLNSKIIRIPRTNFFPVHEHYIDTLSQTFGRQFDFQQFGILPEVTGDATFQSTMFDYTAKLFESLDSFEQREESTARGGVLVFLPGLLEIDTMFKTCMDYLQKRMLENSEDFLKWTLLPLHSTITTEEQQRVFHPTKPGWRKIILATNIAESSITVTDMKYVFDFCLTKSMSCDPSTNYSCLRLEWASQDQCVQRRGRVGRVSEGHVFRMITQKAYELLRKETVPDMEKACLENVILCVKTLDLGSPTSVMALAIDPPAQSAIKLAICNLKEVGALTIELNGVYDAYDGDLTMMGNLMAKLPFDIRFSRLIALGHVFGVLEEAVIIAAGLSVKSAFSFPFTQRLVAYLSKLMWSNETFSDCFAIINLFRTWVNKTTNGDFRSYDQLRKWKQSYFVQTNVLREIYICIQDVIKRLENSNMEVEMNHLIRGNMSAEQGLMLKIAIAGAFYPNYFMRFRPDPTDYARQIARELSSLDPLMSLFYTGFPNEQPGELYAMHIAEKFESINSAPYIKVYGSKVLVEFDPRGDRIGPMSINLFKGIKMRQLRHEVRIGGIRSDRAHTICDEEKSNWTSRVFESPKQCVLPGINENHVLVSVTRMLAPDNFWVMYQTELARFNQLSIGLLDKIFTCKALKARDAIPGSLCIVKHESLYFRARVEYITTNKVNVMLFLIDTGEVVWRQPAECYQFSQDLVDAQLHKYPATGMKCRIYGIKPLEKYAGAWSEEAYSIMSDVLARNNNVVALQVYSVVEGVIACDIFGRREDGKTGKDSGIRKALLGKRLTAEMEEPKSSRDNQNLRKNVNRTEFPQSQIDRFNQLQRSDTAPPILLQPPAEKNCTLEFNLKGPNSPLEMKFRALSASTHTKSVGIDGCSVNSVALDENPSAPASRILVAANVGISQKSGSVVLRETTLLPPIPGLPGLLTMLFCPTMQLHSNSHCGRYTGCLSGLGKDYTTDTPVYPDHDMEVVFDTLLDEKDVHTINGIRVTMNLVLSGEHVAKHAIDDLRSSVRNDIRRLLERPRVAVEEIYPRDEYIWKDDPKKEAAHRKRCGVKRMTFSIRQNDVFPVHSLEVLTTKQRNLQGRDGIQEEPQYDFFRS